MINRDSIAKQVYVQLKKIIVLQETPGYKMGDHLNEAAIAAYFKCSVTPVRECINMLRRDHLIVGDSYKSSLIVTFDSKAVRDLFDVRECLEVWALENAFSKFTPRDIEEMHHAHERYGLAYENFDEEEIILANAAFHDTIVHRAGNDLLAEELSGIRDRVSMVRGPIARRRKAGGNRERLMIPVREHQAIMEGIESGNLTKARAALTTHMERIANESCEYYENYVKET